jgi:hypothetical protein
MRFAPSLFAALLIVGCKDPAKDAPAPAASTPTTASATAAASAPAAGLSASASASAGAGHSDTCEVEIFGKVNLPKDLPKGKKVIVYVAQDDCLSDTAQILGHVEAGAMDGSIVIEVFPKWGTDVTICAGVDEGEGKPTTMYGKAKGTFHAEAEGEVTFADVKIDLAKGKPHVPEGQQGHQAGEGAV